MDAQSNEPTGPRGSDHESADTARLDALVAESLDVLEKGGDDALAKFLTDHPADAARIRERLALLGELGMLNEDTPTDSLLPERLGEFRIVQQIGGGGMGVVCLAIQEPLGREVALKLIRRDQLYFPGARERFRREIAIVARLRHPGIVPVFTVGEDAGLPFFAMEKVEGCTLDEALEPVRGERPPALGAELREFIAQRAQASTTGDLPALFAGSWIDTALRIVRLVAEALEYAHREGVLHRDVKPSNVMVTPDGRVMLVDFGLARSEGDHRLTESSSHLGTLNYLPPECLEQGTRAFDRTSDVYSLGVVLYQLLTNELPFQADSRPVTLMRIAEGRPNPPRALAPEISWEAETVCLKAIDRDPQRRYPTAASFAADLSNVLEQRPIVARRAGTALRLKRWVQRRPAEAAGAVFAAMVVLGGPLLYALQQRELADQRTQQLAEVRAAQAATEDQRQRAELNLDRAMEAVDRFLSRVGEDVLETVPQMEEPRRLLLGDAVEFYQGFLEVEGDRPEVRLRAARAQRTAGNLLLQLGRLDEAHATHQRGIELARGLAAEFPDRADILEELASGYIDLGKALGMAGRLDQSEPVIESGIEALEGLLRLTPDAEHPRAMLAINLANHSMLMGMTGRVPEARRSMLRAAAIQGELVDAGGEHVVRHRAVLANITSRLVDLPAPSGSVEDSTQDAVEETEQTLRMLVASLSESEETLEPFDRAQRANVRTHLGTLLHRRGRQAEGDRELEQSLAELDQLVRDFPDTVYYRAKLAVAHQARAEAALATDPERADTDFARAIELFTPHDASEECPPEAWAGRSACWEGRADALRGRELHEQRLTHLEQALHCQRQALEPFPEHAHYRSSLAVLLERTIGLAEQLERGELSRELNAELEALARPSDGS